MGKAIRRVRGEGQKTIVRLMESLTGRHSGWEVWQDFIIMSAISIANAIGGPHREAREKEYLTRAGKYTAKEIEVFAQMLYEVSADLDRNPDQDFLGELFMALDLGNEWKGQFFTPYSVCRAMASITYGDDLQAQIEKHGWTAVNDPACGAGALLIAFANECRRPRAYILLCQSGSRPPRPRRNTAKVDGRRKSVPARAQGRHDGQRNCRHSRSPCGECWQHEEEALGV